VKEATTTAECTGNVTRMSTHENVRVDSESYRSVTVNITRCTDCSGTAQVVDFDGIRTSYWNSIPIPVDLPLDSVAAYWAADFSAYTAPDRIDEPEVPELPRTPEPGEPGWDDYAAAMEEQAAADALAEADADRAFAEALERRAESGTWFGSDPAGAEHW